MHSKSWYVLPRVPCNFINISPQPCKGKRASVPCFSWSLIFTDTYQFFHAIGGNHAELQSSLNILLYYRRQDKIVTKCMTPVYFSLFVEQTGTNNSKNWFIMHCKLYWLVYRTKGIFRVQAYGHDIQLTLMYGLQVTLANNAINK
jgi:hypothetical protein